MASDNGIEEEIRAIRREKDAYKREQFKKVIDQLKPGVSFQYKEEETQEWTTSEFVNFTDSRTEPGSLTILHRPENWPPYFPIPKQRLRGFVDMRISPDSS